MRKVLRKCPFDVLVVHDDYLTHPNNVNFVRTAYIDAMAEIAEIPLLDSILSQITEEDVHIEKYTDNLGEKIREGNYALS